MWIKKANGWKRLWLVVTVCGLLWTGLISPFYHISPPEEIDGSVRRMLEEDYANPDCSPYFTNSVTELKQPVSKRPVDIDSKWGGRFKEFPPCTYIYDMRTKYGYSKSPFVLEDYFKEVNDNYRKAYWLKFMTTSMLGSFFMLILSALVYLTGFIISWIIAGFKK